MIRQMIFTLILLAETMTAWGEENLALSKKYALSPAPNYELCTDSGDATQLTDGKTTDEYFWKQIGTVGWSNRPWAEVTIDLEKVEPIDSIAFTSAAGTAGVSWPAMALALVSEDGETWFDAGDLMVLDSAQHGPLDATKYNRRKIVADGLATKGRFVKLHLRSSGPYLFLDEIEIGRGDDQRLAEPIKGKKIESVEKWAERNQFASLIKRRYAADCAKIATLVINRHDATDDAILKEKLAALAERVKAVKPDEDICSSVDPKTFRTIFPYDPVHAEIFAMQAEYWRLNGVTKPLVVERVEPFDFVRPWTDLPTDSGTTGPLVMARNEISPCAFLLYNTTDKPAEVTISLGGDFALAPEKSVRCYDIPWTDTARQIPVAAALCEAKRTGKNCFVTILLPGLPKQIGFDVDSKNIPAGTYNGAILFDMADRPSVDFPLTLTVADVLLPDEQSLTLGGWDYTDGGGSYNVNAKNLDTFLATAKMFGVNAPWAKQETMLSGVTGKKTDVGFDISFDTQTMDEWLALWPEAKGYYIFLAVPDTFCGINFDDADFTDAVSAWAQKWGEYFETKKIAPRRVSLLISDEPGMPTTLDIRALLAWAKAIKKGEPRFRIWEDPIYSPPSDTPAELVDVCDVICPNRPQWLSNRSLFESVYRPMRDQGKQLDFYSCAGPSRLLDPYNYFRLQAWHIFAEGGKTSFFWSLTEGSSVSGWNEYLVSHGGFCPMFIDPDDSRIVPAKQLAAMRKSVYDFELLTMLRDFSERNADTEMGKRARRLLDEKLPAILWAPGCENIFWFDEKDRTAADAFRRELLDLLTE